MTIEKRWPLQKAVFERLTDALRGEGIEGVDVPVFDHIPARPPRLYVRIDGFSLVPGGASNGRRARHDFSVHVFDTNTGEETGLGPQEVARLQPIVVNALEDWTPFEGATGLQHVRSNSAGDTDPLTQHVVSRFSTHIGV